MIGERGESWWNFNFEGTFCSVQCGCIGFRVGVVKVFGCSRGGSAEVIDCKRFLDE